MCFSRLDAAKLLTRSRDATAFTSKYYELAETGGPK